MSHIPCYGEFLRAGRYTGADPSLTHVLSAIQRPELTMLAGAQLAGNMRKIDMAKKNNAKRLNSGNEKVQTFSITAPTALSVQLVADFTQWQNHPISLEKGEDGVWRTTTRLEPGQHHYRFLVDGQWRDDPECTVHVPNPYGSQDAVRHVG